ncbi:MAG: hypothetical protein ACOYOQ_15275, partial [Microthrixaceae bacterium]
ALLEAATKDWGEQVLYLTFSGRLQSLAEQQLRTFTPDGVSSESMTFGQMMALLGATGPGVEQPITLPKLIDRLERALQDYRGNLGKWKRRIPELYAQLHAHAFGQALPIEFDGVTASTGEALEKKTFVELRRESLGKGTAEKVIEVAQFLVERDRVAECFPGIHAARRLLDESLDELPASIAGSSVVLIDEVQDLTKVEAMLVLSVVGRIARDQGRMPYLFVAGDESQTVRPTAFTWAWFTNLMTSTLGPVAGRRTDIDLRSNLRSPKVVADLIQATRSHYRLLDRDDRPGGMVYDDPEIDREGRLFYCHAPGDDWAVLVELFRSQPSAQLVYPGAVPPDDVGDDADVATSDQVKGLGFDLVGVVDAGERQEQLVQLAADNDHGEGERLAGTLGRNLADQFRVAVSRAQEHLVLLDRDGDRVAAVQELLDEVETNPIERVDVATLTEVLGGDVDTLEWFETRLADVQSILTDEPERALMKIRPAVDRMGAEGVRAELPDQLVSDVLRVAGIAAYLASVEEQNLSRRGRAEALEREAIEHLDQAGYGTEMAALLALRRGAPAPAPEVVSAAARAHYRIANELADVEALVGLPLVAWFERTETQGLSASGEVDAVIAALDAVSQVLDGRTSDVSGRQRVILIRSAERAQVAEDFDRALRLLDEVDDVDVDLMAGCLRGAGRLDDAIALYEQEGRLDAALDLVRDTGDMDRSIELAERYAPDVAGRLRWAKDLLGTLSEDLTEQGEPLTRTEIDALITQVAEALERTLTSEPSDEAAVNRWGIVDVLEFEAEAADVFLEAPGDLDGPFAEGDSGDIDTPLESDVVDGDVPSAPEFVAEPVPNSDRDELTMPPPTPPPYPPPQPTSAADAAELIPLSQLAGEFGVGIEDARATCRKLGIAPVGAGETLSVAQADRLRRRMAG